MLPGLTSPLLGSVERCQQMCVHNLNTIGSTLSGYYSRARERPLTSKVLSVAICR